METASEIKVNYSFINKDLDNLLLHISAEEKSPILIAPFERYGRSGSGLYKLYFSEKEDGSLPFLLKTFKDKEKFKREKDSMKHFSFFYDHANIIGEYEGALSAIIIKNFSQNEVSGPKTLANIMHERSEEEICKIIDTAFSDLIKVYKADKTENCNIKEKYHRYLRNDRTKRIIKYLTGDNIEEKKIDFHQQEITNPVYVWDNLKDDIDMPISLVHGDLHPNNIVIYDENNPRIVDFEWSCENDIYIDFSLLEISVRYFKPPFFMDYKLKNELEEIFLCENIDVCVDKYNQEIKRMIMIVRKIREWCKKYTKKKYDFGHHLLSQFLILYGLQAHDDDYNPFLVTPFLAKLGDKLIKEDYVK